MPGFLILLAGLLFGIGIGLGVAPASANGEGYTCRYFGADYALGRSICLETPQGPRVAACKMALNNPAWKPGSEACSPAEGKTERVTGRALDFIQEYRQGIGAR